MKIHKKLVKDLLHKIVNNMQNNKLIIYSLGYIEFGFGI